MNRLLGHPVRTFRTETASQDPRIPMTYRDLGISSQVTWVWHCFLEVDKLNFFRHTTGRTEKEAFSKMLRHGQSLKQDIDKFLISRTQQ